VIGSLRLAGVITSMTQAIRLLALFPCLAFSTVIFNSPQGLAQARTLPPNSAQVIKVGLDRSDAGGGTRQQPLRVSVDLVLIPVTVTDALNHPHTNLTRENFTVYEGSQTQEIRYFSTEDSPISIGLLLDVSGSMRDKIDTERTALEQFFRNANPEDDYFVITFNNTPRVLSDVTQSTAGIETELGLVEPSGSTALLDAMYLGLSKLRSARYSRRALVIISDGGDNASRYNFREIKDLVAESDVMVYAIGIFGSSPFKAFEEVMGERWLKGLTDITGGRTSTVKNINQLPEECAHLSRELRSQYILGYQPSDKLTVGKWRKVRVTVRNPTQTDQLQSHYRRGYYATP